MRAILGNTPYPAMLYYAILNRMRTDMDDAGRGIRKINYVRAAVIKAYLTRKYRNQNQDQIKEVLCMSLNESSTNLPICWVGCLLCWRKRSTTRWVKTLGPASRTDTSRLPAPHQPRFFQCCCAFHSTIFQKRNTVT